MADLKKLKKEGPRPADLDEFSDLISGEPRAEVDENVTTMNDVEGFEDEHEEAPRPDITDETEEDHTETLDNIPMAAILAYVEKMQGGE
jgi:hypothetical protein